MIKRNILIVEDEAIIAEDIKLRLENLGYSVVNILDNYESIMKELEKKEIDLILMDIMIKGIMDGIQVAQLIKTKYDTPIIFITSYSDENTVERAKLTESYGYLLKPIHQKELQIVIDFAFYKHLSEIAEKKEKEWYEAILNSLKTPIIATDKENNIKFINLEARKKMGKKAVRAEGKSVYEIIKLKKEDKSVESCTICNREGDIIGNLIYL